MKPNSVFNFIKFNINLSDFIRLNMKTFFMCFEEGAYSKNDFGESRLLYKHYNKKYIYDKIPRCARYNMTESHFRNLSFRMDDFYDYDEDENLIIKEYCEAFLKLYPDHQKTNNILNKLKLTEAPELFI